MFDHLDILRSAKLLIREHGARAADEAARQVTTLLARGDWEGDATWRRILKAVDELQATAPTDAA
jgi:triphosphoribosyl-dephospho-CoA synthetase